MTEIPNHRTSLFTDGGGDGECLPGANAANKSLLNTTILVIVAKLVGATGATVKYECIESYIHLSFSSRPAASLETTTNNNVCKRQFVEYSLKAYSVLQLLLLGTTTLLIP